MATLLFLSCLTEIIVLILMSLGMHYYAIYLIFCIFEYGLITLLLAWDIQEGWKQKMMFWSVGVFAIACLIFSLMKNNWEDPPSEIYVIEGFLTIVWCLFALWAMEVDKNKTVYQHSTFWFIVAFFIYCLGTITFNGINNYLPSTPERRVLFSAVNAGVNLVSYSIMLNGFFYCKWEQCI
ncbi:hypothetical protein [Mucilaginibacter aquaedulcis]|uniref:hypothetical protein n=1 Tax=Mucilaginibacter aquaedulcis TaxID=1187081 RepID=UPI0025B5AF61|nr:hypothetical protein [Mucilaginibacter aquaedulcis]MDN3548945.1 hypothetical protein [Mucilaginibacter aquaedulcis]